MDLNCPSVEYSESVVLESVVLFLSLDIFYFTCYIHMYSTWVVQWFLNLLPNQALAVGLALATKVSFGWKENSRTTKI